MTQPSDSCGEEFQKTVTQIGFLKFAEGGNKRNDFSLEKEQSMKTIRQLGSMMVRIAIAFSLLFGMGVRSDAQEKTSAQKFSSSTKKPPAAPPSQTAGAEKPSGGPHEGIKVHGHWVIEVHNPDGSFVSHTVFENGLAQLGSNALAGLLARKTTLGPWAIRLLLTNPAGEMAISETGYTTNSLVPNFQNLNISAPGDGTLVLSGNATASSAQSISQVWTSNEPSGSLFTLTVANLTNPVAVAQGQIVQVTVTISFS